MNTSINEEEKQSDLYPTPGPTRYTLRMNEILVENFI